MLRFFMVSLLFVSFVEAKIVLNVIPIIDRDIVAKGVAPLGEFLEAELGEEVVIEVGKNYKEGEDKIMKGKITLAFIGPFATAKLMKKSHFIIPLVKLMKNNKTNYRGAIIVKKGSKIKKMSDFKGKRFVFGDPSSTLSSAVPKFMLSIAGVKLKDLKSYKYTGSHSNVIKEILANRADGGGVKENFAIENSDKLKIIKYTMYVPNFTILANAKYTSRKKLAKIKNALLMFKNNSDSIKIGPFGKLDGFKMAYKSEYIKLYKLIK